METAKSTWCSPPLSVRGQESAPRCTPAHRARQRYESVAARPRQEGRRDPGLPLLYVGARRHTCLLWRERLAMMHPIAPRSTWGFTWRATPILRSPRPTRFLRIQDMVTRQGEKGLARRAISGSAWKRPLKCGRSMAPTPPSRRASRAPSSRQAGRFRGASKGPAQGSAGYDQGYCRRGDLRWRRTRSARLRPNRWPDSRTSLNYGDGDYGDGDEGRIEHDPGKSKLLFTPGPLTTSATVKGAMLRDLGSLDSGIYADSARCCVHACSPWVRIRAKTTNAS